VKLGIENQKLWGVKEPVVADLLQHVHLVSSIKNSYSMILNAFSVLTGLRSNVDATCDLVLDVNHMGIHF